MTKTEMDIRLTKIFSAAAIALATPDKRAVCKQLKQFERDARAQELFALAGEASQMRWQLVAELQQARAAEVSHGSV
ncbi:hypothetical protein OB956_09240 [Aeromonas dhakensis]|uniref:hypothetical protein n=1 Tax=Aeromonas dhakensis TaxID=196024 RepID=UPI00259E833D|nr:hypothetical protein [Aeromonas dhakensis]MDM5054463.1 hypothetical protein [Aeromonas dhakensis]MDM5080726.1 hypothetical protein [Aeromonas dhakensis]